MAQDQGDNSARFILRVPPATLSKDPGQTHTLFELRQLPIKNSASILWGKRYSHAMVFCKDMETFKRRSLYTCFIMGVRAKQRALIDEKGRELNISIGTFLGSLGKLAFEALISPVVLLFSFLMLWAVKLTQRQ